MVFEVEGQPYACPIERIERLLRLADAVLQPASQDGPPWEMGRFTIPGQAEGIAAVSLRVLWEMSPLLDLAAQNSQAILVVNCEGRQAALIVDRCRCVLSLLPTRLFRLSSALKGLRGRAFRTALPWDGHLLVLLDLEELIEQMFSPTHVLSPL